MRNLPTTRQLRYFVALDDYGHFGKAAESCFVSQPAFSVAIRELESLLNLQLADRTNKQVTITAIGREIAEQARLVLRDMEGILDIAEFHQEPLGGTLRLGVIPTIAPFLLPKLLPRMRRAFPSLKLFLHEDQTQPIYEKLQSGELDLLLIALPYPLKNTESETLFEDPFHFACRKDTRLFDPETQSIEQLPDDTILLLEYGHCLREQAMTACKIHNANKVSRISANSLLTLVEMVDADLGVTYLPQMAIDSFLLKHTRVTTWPMKSESRREIGLVWRKGSVRGKEFRELGEFIRSHHG